MRPRPLCVALLLASLVPQPAATAERLAPLLRAATPALAASDDFRWTATLVLLNPFEGGLYPDSLFVKVEDLDPGETRVGRSARTDISRILRAAPDLSAGDSASFDYDAPATAERARLTFTFHAHDAAGATHVSEAVVEARPGPATTGLPSRLLEAGGHKVETVFVPAADTSRPAPGVLLVHGHASHARLMLPLARALSQRGFAVMLASLPGYGLSQGPADFGGPATRAAIEAAFDALRAAPGVDRARLGAWGLSRGAGPLVDLAARRPELRAVVAQSGVYDLWAVHRGTALAGFPEAIVAEAGRDSAAWRARSPLLQARAVKAALLVMHGEKDTNVPAGQAHALAAALTAAGRDVETWFPPAAGHLLPAGEMRKRAFEFLERRLATP